MTVEDLNIEFGNNLRDILADYDMTQEELANALGISKTTVNYYVNGERTPSLKNIINIMYVLECTFDELVGVDEFIE